MFQLQPEDANEPFPRAQGRAAAKFIWPDWARTARIAGAYFSPENSQAELAARLDLLAAERVSVVIADSPWGEQYAAWVDEARFVQVWRMMSEVVELAHERGIKVVMYHVGLELISPSERNPWLEHPEWAQLALDGRPILFNDVSNQEEHWLSLGIWDYWLSPCGDNATPGSFRQFMSDRLGKIVQTGIDGLWIDQVYLQSSVGRHHDLWPSSDPCSAAAFASATGLKLPARLDWDDPVFRRWVVWRHQQIADYLLALKTAVRAVNPDLVFLNENSSVDLGRSTYVGNDPTVYLAYPDMSTGHEIGSIANRMDAGETGMKEATLDQWLDFRCMAAFARASDRGKPSWILTYGYEPRDSAQLAGLVLAEGANFYETKGPQMADSAGSDYRRRLFSWIAAHEDALYTSDSAAVVGLLFSPRTRDLVDTVSGELYDPQDSIHFAAYRAMAKLLYGAHIPFDVVIDSDIEAFGHYRVLIVPEVQAMSEAAAAALRRFPGRLLIVGDSGSYDEWLQPRPENALARRSAQGTTWYADTPDAALAQAADTGLLVASAPPSVQIGLRKLADGYALVLVNTAAAAAPAFSVNLRIAEKVQDAKLHLSLFSARASTPIQPVFDRGVLRISIPAGIDTIALLHVELAE